MKKLLILSLSTLLLAGCQGLDSNNYTSSGASWRGSRVNLLTNTFGQPDQVRTKANGNKLYVYKTMGFAPTSMNGGPQVGVNVSATGAPVVTSGPPSGQMNRRMITCTATYEIDKTGKIVNVTQEGSNC